MFRRRVRRSAWAPRILALMAAIVLGQFVYLALVPIEPRYVERKPDPIFRPEPSGQNGQANASANIPIDRGLLADSGVDDGPSSTAITQQIVEDDTLLYASPDRHSNRPIDLAWLPSNPKLIARFAPARLSGTPLGDVPSALDESVRDAFDDMAAAVKLPAAMIADVTVAMYSDDERLEPLLIVRTRRPIDVSTFTAAMRLRETSLPGNLVAYQDDRWTYAPLVQSDVARPSNSIDPDDAEASDPSGPTPATFERYAVGDPLRVRAAMRRQATPAELSPPMRTAHAAIGSGADVTVIFEPNLLFDEARVLVAKAIPVAPAVRGFIVSNFAAVGVQATQDADATYVETRLVAGATTSPPSLLRTIRTELPSVPPIIREITERVADDPAYNRLVERFPSMVEFTISLARFDIADRVVTGNVYLPGPAPTQLTGATLLVANAPRRVIGAAAATELTLDEILAKPISVSFPQESLKASVEAVVAEVTRVLPPAAAAPTIEIIGGDLQKEGITQNQQIRNFERTDTPLSDVLTALMIAANIDKTVTRADDPGQRLVWVRDPGATDKILITTRSAAEDQYELPPAFVTNASSPE